MPYNHAKFQVNMLNLLCNLSGHCHISMPKYTHTEHSKLSSSWYDAPRALYADFVTRSLATNEETKMVAPGGIAGSENRLISFFWTDKNTTCRTRTIHLCLQFICWGYRIEMLHKRLSEAGETVFILRERWGERASKLISSDRDLEKTNFHRNMDELSTHLTRLRVYFENMASCIFLGSE